MSGARQAEYEKPISIYLRRFGRKDINLLYQTFPRAVRSTDFIDYPSSVIEELQQAGYTAPKTKHGRFQHPLPQDSLMDTVFISIFLLVLVALLIGLIVQGTLGILTIWQWLVD